MKSSEANKSPQNCQEPYGYFVNCIVLHSRPFACVMKRNSIAGILLCVCLLLLFQTACNKSPVIRRVSGYPCDTCTSTTGVTPIDKEVTINLIPTNWRDMGNGKFICEFEHLMEVQGLKLDSVRLLTIYVGLGRDAIKLQAGLPADYNGGSILWSGLYDLTLQLPTGAMIPQFLAIRLALHWI